MKNLVLEVDAADRYSFNFEGAAEIIDHIVVSPALAAGGRGRHRPPQLELSRFRAAQRPRPGRGARPDRVMGSRSPAGILVRP